MFEWKSNKVRDDSVSWRGKPVWSAAMAEFVLFGFDMFYRSEPHFIIYTYRLYIYIIGLTFILWHCGVGKEVGVPPLIKFHHYKSFNTTVTVVGRATMVEDFFLLSCNNNKNLVVDNSIALLSGPPSSGKTSLLFQFAFNCLHLNNSSSSSYVTFISGRPKLHTNPPFLSKGIDPSSFDEFNRIQIKYVEDEEGINKFFAAFHMHDSFPVLVIIDGFGDFFDEKNCQQRYRSPRGRELAIVRTLALCRNAVNHANETGPCMLLFSDTHHGDTPKFLHIYKRWIDSVYTIKGDGFGSFILKNNSGLPGSCGSEMAKTKSAKYSIALHHLVLEETYENEEQLYLM